MDLSLTQQRPDFQQERTSRPALYLMHYLSLLRASLVQHNSRIEKMGDTGRIVRIEVTDKEREQFLDLKDALHVWIVFAKEE